MSAIRFGNIRAFSGPNAAQIAQGYARQLNEKGVVAYPSEGKVYTGDDVKPFLRQDLQIETQTLDEAIAQETDRLLVIIKKYGEVYHQTLPKPINIFPSDFGLHQNLVNQFEAFRKARQEEYEAQIVGPLRVIGDNIIQECYQPNDYGLFSKPPKPISQKMEAELSAAVRTMILSEQAQSN